MLFLSRLSDKSQIYLFLKKKRTTLSRCLIYFSSDSLDPSEENSSVLTTLFSFSMPLHSSKNTCRLRTESNLYYRPTNIIRACFRYFYSTKICNLITERSYFAFWKLFIVDGVTKKIVKRKTSLDMLIQSSSI